MTNTKYFLFFFKELNKNKSQISRVFFTIFLSLLIFSTVTIFKNCIENEIENSSKIFLGGDLELSKKNKVLNIDFFEKLKESFLVTEVIEFTSIIKTNKKESKTTRIKVIDNLYPLIGEVKVEPPNSLRILKNQPDGILIDKTTRNNLDLKLGDKIIIQNFEFEVIGIIDSLPEIGNFFLFGDQALINKSGFENLKVNNLGSFINYKYKMLNKETKQDIPDYIFKDKDLSIKFPKDISENLKKTIENFIYFLTIMAASAILISGIGLKNSLFSFLSNNQLKIAIYKSLGLNSKSIKTLYYLQMLTILVFCSLISYILGLFIISIFDNVLSNLLKIELQVKFNIYEYLIVLFFSLFIFLIYAKPTFDTINQIKVRNLFRNSSSNLKLNYNKNSLLEMTIFLIIFITFFCIINVKPFQTAFFFFFFFIISFFYYSLSKLYILILNKIKSIQNITFKMGFKNLNNYQNLNSIIIMTMGVGITTLLFLGILCSNINKELNTSIPKDAPDYFFLGIQKDEKNLFSKHIYEIDNQAQQKIVPIISARIEAINNRAPKEFANKNNQSFWFINGERRISWLKDPPSNNQIVEGMWWIFDKKKKLKLSLDHKVAKDLKLKIGDSITFNIYGNLVSGVITNFRKVDYRDLNINFAILFNPKYASEIPHEFLSTIKFKDKEQIILNELLNKLPNITYIKLSDYINKTKNFLDKMFIISIVMSGLVVAIGLVVVSNAMSVMTNLKVYQNLVFRILGFERSGIIKLILFESLIIFIPIIFFSLFFAILLSYMLIVNFFNIEWYFSFKISFLISSLSLIVLVLTLLISNQKYLNFNTYSLLRNE